MLSDIYSIHCLVKPFLEKQQKNKENYVHNLEYNVYSTYVPYVPMYVCTYRKIMTNLWSLTT